MALPFCAWYMVRQKALPLRTDLELRLAGDVVAACFPERLDRQGFPECGDFQSKDGRRTMETTRKWNHGPLPVPRKRKPEIGRIKPCRFAMHGNLEPRPLDFKGFSRTGMVRKITRAGKLIKSGMPLTGLTVETRFERRPAAFLNMRRDR